MTIYPGRHCRVAHYSAEFPARGRFARVIPSAQILPPGVCRVLVLEFGQPWETTINETELEPLTEGQAALAEKHGMPTDFADACFRALGEISIDEAWTAIRKYNGEFLAAQ